MIANWSRKGGTPSGSDFTEEETEAVVGTFGTLVLYTKSKVPRRVPKKTLIYQAFWGFFRILVLWYSIFNKVN